MQLQSYGLNLKIIGGTCTREFTRKASAQKTDAGFVTSNVDLYRNLLRPSILQNRIALQLLDTSQKLNALQLLTFLVYDAYLGKPDQAGHFYRWGGDIYDIDLPQQNDIRTSKAFGLDCSGYVAAGFDIAILEGLFTDAEINAAPFLLTRKENLADIVPGTPSDLRLNVSDFQKIGVEYFNETNAFDSRMEGVLQAGDFIVIPRAPGIFPHVVSIVKIGTQLFVAESANRGSLTKEYIGEFGTFLPLDEALNRLKNKEVKFSVRGIH
jgi:hypothetical protein